MTYIKRLAFACILTCFNATMPQTLEAVFGVIRSGQMTLQSIASGGSDVRASQDILYAAVEAELPLPKGLYADTLHKAIRNGLLIEAIDACNHVSDNARVLERLAEWVASTESSTPRRRSQSAPAKFRTCSSEEEWNKFLAEPTPVKSEISEPAEIPSSDQQIRVEEVKKPKARNRRSQAEKRQRAENAKFHAKAVQIFPDVYIEGSGGNFNFINSVLQNPDQQVETSKKSKTRASTHKKPSVVLRDFLRNLSGVSSHKCLKHLNDLLVKYRALPSDTALLEYLETTSLPTISRALLHILTGIVPPKNATEVLKNLPDDLYPNGITEDHLTPTGMRATVSKLCNHFANQSEKYDSFYIHMRDVMLDGHNYTERLVNSMIHYGVVGGYM